MAQHTQVNSIRDTSFSHTPYPTFIQTIVSVLIPTLGKVFNAPQLIAWVGTAYLLTNTAVQPLYGKLSDIFGR